MAQDNGGGSCKYCWRPSYIDGHNEGCPVLVGTPEAIAGWERGYAYGFDDNYIEPWRYRLFTAVFLMGYRAGKAEIDRLVDEAVRSRYFQ